MRTLCTSLAAILLLFAVPTTAAANGVGKPLPDATLEGFTQIDAKDFDDLAGRAMLIEFFAYW